MAENTELMIIGWGHWGRNVTRTLNPRTLAMSRGKFDLLQALIEQLDQLSSRSTVAITIYDKEEWEGRAQICPGPCAAELLFSLRTGELSSSLDAPVRLHILHAGEHYATGAATAFLREAGAQQESLDIGLVLLPPKGCNDATVGRFCASLYGAPHFLDVCILLDVCSPLLLQWDDPLLERTVIDLVTLISCFDRSCCMLPLLQRMQARSLSLFMVNMEELLSERLNFPKLFARRNTVHNSGGERVFSTSPDFLSFSVSSGTAKSWKRESRLQELYKQYVERNKIIHIPFARRYGWAKLPLPAGFQKPGETRKDMAGILSADVIPDRVKHFLKAYYKEYWRPEGSLLQEECLSEDTKRWLKVQLPSIGEATIKRLAAELQPLEYVSRAKEFFATHLAGASETRQ